MKQTYTLKIDNSDFPNGSVDQTLWKERNQRCYDALSNLFTEIGFEVATGDLFGSVDGRISGQYTLRFGIKITDEIGFYIGTWDFDRQYQQLGFGIYTIKNGAVKIYDNHSGSQSGIWMIHASYDFIFEIDKTEDNIIIDCTEVNCGMKNGLLIASKFNDFRLSDNRYIVLLANSSNYPAYAVSGNDYMANYDETANTSKTVQSPLTLPIKNTRYACYQSPVVLKDSGYVHGKVEGLVGLAGNFSHAFKTVVDIEGKKFMHIGKNIYCKVS